MSRAMILTRLGLPIAALAAISVQTAPASAQSSASPFTYATRYDAAGRVTGTIAPDPARSEEHTSELQSLMRISYAVFCLKKKKISATDDMAHYTYSLSRI